MSATRRVMYRSWHRGPGGPAAAGAVACRTAVRPPPPAGGAAARSAELDRLADGQPAVLGAGARPALAQQPVHQRPADVAQARVVHRERASRLQLTDVVDELGRL